MLESMVNLVLSRENIADAVLYYFRFNVHFQSGNKQFGDVTSRTLAAEWDICINYYNKRKSPSCSRGLHLLPNNREITLHRACEEGRLAVIKYILFHGIADINCPGKIGRTPVMSAVRTGQASVFDFLVSNGCNLAAVDYINGNVLHFACEGGNIAIVKKLLASGKIGIENKNMRQITPMLQAVYYGHKTVFDLLVNEGCDLKDNFNILYAACGGGHDYMVKYMISQNIVDLESRNSVGMTPVMDAAYHGYKKIFDCLVNLGCNLKVVEKRGYNVLHLACMSGRIDIVKHILSMNIFHKESRTTGGLTPVMVAANGGYRKLFEFLGNMGCNLKEVGNDGSNVLHVSLMFDHIDMVKYIVSMNIVDKESKNKRGQTPVFWAAKYGHPKAFKFLVNKGCDFKVVDKSRRNVLHAACKYGHLEMVKYLITLPAVEGMKKAKNKYGRTPIQDARHYHRSQVVNILKQAVTL